jgi:alkylation response protein AidB-like acyl-CoA dehydrogenase
VRSMINFHLDEEQQVIYDQIVAFASKELNDRLVERDAAKEFYWDGWKKCADLGIQGLPIPNEWGGAGANALTCVIAMQGFGFGCKDNGLTHVLNSHLWGCEIPIWKFGSKSQKQKYLPALAKGKLLGGHAITEPDAGSDVFSMRTTATRNGGSYIINGSKSIVSNAPIADLVIVFAVTNPRRKFLGGISAFVLEKGMPGLKFGKALEKMGLNTQPIGEMFFDDCRVPMENLLGGEGSGIKVFNESMEWERSCLFACQVGNLERILADCVQYSKDRIQFGKPIGKNQAIANKIADMKVRLELGKLFIRYIGWLKTQDKRILLESAIAKLFISESLKLAALEAVQIHGGYGYMSEFGIERELRDSVAATIYSGTSEIQRDIIARLLGL